MKKQLISSIYPLSKLTVALCCILLSIFFDWRFAYFFAVPFCILVALIDGKFFQFLRKFLVVVLITTTFIFILRFILDESDSRVLLDIGLFQITEQGILNGLNQTRVIITMIGTLLLFFDTTEMEEFMISLQKMGASPVVSYVALATLQMIPEMNDKSKTILKAQQARGIETEGNLFTRAKAFIPALGPLVISSINDIEEKAITLEVRGFSAETKRTFLNDISIRLSDKIIIIGGLLLTFAAIIWRFFL